MRRASLNQKMGKKPCEVVHRPTVRSTDGMKAEAIERELEFMMARAGSTEHDSIGMRLQLTKS